MRSTSNAETVRMYKGVLYQNWIIIYSRPIRYSIFFSRKIIWGQSGYHQTRQNNTSGAIYERIRQFNSWVSSPKNNCHITHRIKHETHWPELQTWYRPYPRRSCGSCHRHSLITSIKIFSLHTSSSQSVS